MKLFNKTSSAISYRDAVRILSHQGSVEGKALNQAISYAITAFKADMNAETAKLVVLACRWGHHRSYGIISSLSAEELISLVKLYDFSSGEPIPNLVPYLSTIESRVVYDVLKYVEFDEGFKNRLDMLQIPWFPHYLTLATVYEAPERVVEIFVKYHDIKIFPADHFWIPSRRIPNYLNTVLPVALQDEKLLTSLVILVSSYNIFLYAEGLLPADALKIVKAEYLNKGHLWEVLTTPEEFNLIDSVDVQLLRLAFKDELPDSEILPFDIFASLVRMYLDSCAGVHVSTSNL